MTDPSTLVPDGKDARGRFARGNKLGRGNPLAGRAAKIRAVLLEKLSAKDMAEIADVLIAQAKSGDLAAIRELLDRVLGKAGVSVEITGAGGSPIELQQVNVDLAACLLHFEQFGLPTIQMSTTTTKDRNHAGK